MVICAIETVLMYAQVVNLTFSGYACETTVAHLLLSRGGEVHHHGDEDESKVGYVFGVYSMDKVR
jgi:hypothetical protein